MSKKVLVIIGDGMADEPMAVLKNRTPLEVVETPNMDSLARKGLVGMVRNVPLGMEPGSDVAIMSILGYDPAVHYSGRGPLEAISMGIFPAPDEAAFRCNLVTLSDGNLLDYSAGHITTEESAELIKALKEGLDSDTVSFHHGVSFRNIVLVKGDFAGMRSHAPHDHLDAPWRDFLPSGAGAEALLALMEKSREILESHHVNIERANAGKLPANSIWPWSGGRPSAMIPYSKKFRMTGSTISAVDLVRGLGIAAGLAPIIVPGATGMVDTNYEGKAQAAVKALQENDYVLVHIEGIDEAAHSGKLNLKMDGIRRFDRFIVGPLTEAIRSYPDYLLLVLPDHPTPISIRTHTDKPVPFVCIQSGTKPGVSAHSFTEQNAASTKFLIEHGYTLLSSLLDGSIA